LLCDCQVLGGLIASAVVRQFVVGETEVRKFLV
jgi:hypothetical protein